MEHGGALARAGGGRLSIIGGVDDTRAELPGSTHRLDRAAAAEAAGAPLTDADSDPDAALLVAYAAGDAAAFNALYARHERPVFRFLRRSLGAEAEAFADELHQEVWLAVVRNAHALRLRVALYDTRRDAAWQAAPEAPAWTIDREDKERELRLYEELLQDYQAFFYGVRGGKNQGLTRGVGK